MSVTGTYTMCADAIRSRTHAHERTVTKLPGKSLVRFVDGRDRPWYWLEPERWGRSEASLHGTTSSAEFIFDIIGMKNMTASKPTVDVCTGNAYLHAVVPGHCRKWESTSMTWEQRWHPLREEWVIVAAHRNGRPWSGLSVQDADATIPAYDPICPLCPGNPRVSGVTNDDYTSIFLFDNDAPCVGPNAPCTLDPAPGIYHNRPATGVARVICYSPFHNVTLAELPSGRIVELLRAWQDEYCELGERPEVNHLLVFENKGQVVGVSNPHPHCQIYATNFVFKAIEQEMAACQRYWHEHHRGLIEDIIETERRDGRRVICDHGSVIAFVPYFARYAYETFVVPKQAHASLADLSISELRDLAHVLHEVLVRFDNLWKLSFPYVMMLHQAPTDGRAHDAFHFHIEFYPPLRKPNLLKYLAGPEAGGGNFLSDTSPEEKAAELRAQQTVHYKQQPL